MHIDIVEELFIWRLVIEKIVSYSELESLNFIDALKLSAILDFRQFKETQERLKSEKESRNNNGNQS